MRPSWPAQRLWRCIHSPSKRPLVIEVSKRSPTSTHDTPIQHRTLTSTAIRSKRNRSPFQSLSQDDVARLTQIKDREFQPYSKEDIEELAKSYTPEQLRAIALAEEAIPDQDFKVRAKPRNDGFLQPHEKFDDFSRVVPVIDKRYEALYGDNTGYKKFKSITDIRKKTRPLEEDEIFTELGSALLGDIGGGPNSPEARFSQGKNPDPRLELLWNAELEELGDGLQPLDLSAAEAKALLNWFNITGSGKKPAYPETNQILSAWSPIIHTEPSSTDLIADKQLAEAYKDGGFEPRDVLSGIFELLGERNAWHSKQKVERQLGGDRIEPPLNVFLVIPEELMIKPDGPFGPYNADAFREHNKQFPFPELVDSEDQHQEVSTDAAKNQVNEDEWITENEAWDQAGPIKDSFLIPPSNERFDLNTTRELIEQQDDQIDQSLRYVRLNVNDVEVWFNGDLRKIGEILALKNVVPRDPDSDYLQGKDPLATGSDEEGGESMDPPDFETVSRVQKVLERLDPSSKPDLAPELPSMRDPELRWVPELETEDSGDKGVSLDDEDMAAYVRLSRDTGMSVEVIRKLRTKVIVTRFVANQTRMGKIRRSSLMVVAGNEDGMVGLGEASALDPSSAQRTATIRAIRAMKPIKRYENRTIFGQVKSKVGGSVVELSSRPPGFGLRVSHLVFEIARCAGIHDLAMQTPRSRNKMNISKAACEALWAQPDPEEIAKARGKKLVDLRKVYYAGLL